MHVEPDGTGPTSTANQDEDAGPAPRDTRLTAEYGAKAASRGTNLDFLIDGLVQFG